MLGFLTMAPEEDSEGRPGAADRLLSATAHALEARGLRLAGAVQDNLDRGEGRACDMDLRILGDGAVIRISQDLGNCAESCRLDAGAFAQAVGRAEAALARGADLVIVNKFGKQECHGRGFREFIAQALARGVPVLLAVPAGQWAAFHEFAGDLAQPVARDALIDWALAQTAA
ncbi:MAG: DUF2478 domain-containing protein [Paracoccus sp. (in: a-proteobacteria)]|uniref:DUF2478 domain-containing protein n=1 Tax=Paracoccus sp. TaxID=267 RepID=UPI0039E5700A